jgi:hypothetical protein
MRLLGAFLLILRALLFAEGFRLTVFFLLVATAEL